jgi:FMN phosphatase YigB (HAD superfamily)
MSRVLSEKVILVDADGVLLDWIYSFDVWMQRHGYKLVNPDVYQISDRYEIVEDGYKMAKIFNESAWIRKLPPHKNAIRYVKKLHEEHGFIFHLISSLSDDEYSQHLRTKNIREMFGNTPFEKFTYLDTGADKDEALEVYKDSECWWIEDKAENAQLGKDLGLKSILMDHAFNRDCTDIPRAQDWQQVYYYITGQKNYEF